MREGWTYKKIGDLCDITTGKLDANAANENGMYPFFTCSKDPLSINTYAYDCECVLIAGNGDLNVKYYNGKFNAYQRTYILSLKEEIDGTTMPYIYNFFLLYVNELRRKSIGGIIKYIKLGDLANANIPVPSLSEQQSIVAELDKINELISLKKAQLSDLDSLAQSIFYDMFGDPIENEKGWEVKRLGDLCEISSAKRVFIEEVVDSGVPFIRGTELTTLNKLARGEKMNYTLFITKEHYERLKAITGVPKVGDLLIPSINSEGIVWMVDTEEPLYFKDGRVLWVHVNNDEFTSEALQKTMNILIKNIFSSMNGATFAELKLFVLRGLIVPKYPLSLQKEFAKRIELIEQQKAQISSTIKDLETLLASRMQYWFD